MGASLHREDQRTVGSPGTPPPRRGAATNPKVPGSPGIAGTQTHAAQCVLLSTAWANLRVGLANAVLITVERRAETRSQLSKGSSDLPR